MHKIEKEDAQTSFLDSLYAEYRLFMMSIVQMYVGDLQVCEDIFHNAFISLIRNQERIKDLPRPKQKAYILLAARHASIDYLRKERKMNLADVPDDVLMELLSRSREVQTASRAPFQSVEFYSIIRQLSVEDQTLLIGRHVVGLDSNELAQLVGCTAGALRVKLHRANKRAREMFVSFGLRLEDFLS